MAYSGPIVCIPLDLSIGVALSPVVVLQITERKQCFRNIIFWGRSTKWMVEGGLVVDGQLELSQL